MPQSIRHHRPLALLSPLLLALAAASATAAERVDLHGKDLGTLNVQCKAATTSLGGVPQRPRCATPN